MESGVTITRLQGERIQQIFDTSRLKHFKFAPGVESLVAFLRSRSLTPVIITNGHPRIQRDKLAACGADRFFQHILVGGGTSLTAKFFMFWR